MFILVMGLYGILDSDWSIMALSIFFRSNILMALKVTYKYLSCTIYMLLFRLAVFVVLLHIYVHICKYYDIHF